MSATPRVRRSRPSTAPAYYLARPAQVWITAVSARRSKAQDRDREAARPKN
jgi:hypothetical protein